MTESPVESLGRWCPEMYRTWHIKHLGCVAPKIYVLPIDLIGPEPHSLIEAVSYYVECATGEARLLPGEFAPVALASHCAWTYINTVIEYAHEGLLYNRWWDTVTARAAIAAFTEMGCVGEAETVADFNAVVVRDRIRASEFISNREQLGRDDDWDRILAGFDGRIRALDEGQRMGNHCAWLAAKVEHVDTERGFEAAIQRLSKANHLRARRAPLDGSSLRPTKQQAAAIKPIAEKLAGLASVNLGNLQYIGVAPLSNFIIGGDPVPTMVWRFTCVADRPQDEVHYSVVIRSPNDKEAAEATLHRGDLPRTLGTLPISEREHRLCGLSLG